MTRDIIVAFTEHIPVLFRERIYVNLKYEQPEIFTPTVRSRQEFKIPILGYGISEGKLIEKGEHSRAYVNPAKFTIDRKDCKKFLDELARLNDGVLDIGALIENALFMSERLLKIKEQVGLY